MKDIETILDELEELRPQDVHEDKIATPPRDEGKLYEPDDDDIEDMLADCHTFLVSLLEIKVSKWVREDANDLIKRLAEVVAWNRIH